MDGSHLVWLQIALDEVPGWEAAGAVVSALNRLRGLEGWMLNHTFLSNFPFGLKWFQEVSVPSTVSQWKPRSPRCWLLVGAFREVLKHQVLTIRGITFLQGLLPSGPKEIIGIEHQDFTLWASDLSYGCCPALGSKRFVQVRAGGSEFLKLGLDQKTAGANTPKIIF